MTADKPHQTILTSTLYFFFFIDAWTVPFITPPPWTMTEFTRPDEYEFKPLLTLSGASAKWLVIVNRVRAQRSRGLFGSGNGHHKSRGWRQPEQPHPPAPLKRHNVVCFLIGPSLWWAGKTLQKSYLHILQGIHLKVQKPQKVGFSCLFSFKSYSCCTSLTCTAACL